MFKILLNKQEWRVPWGKGEMTPFEGKIEIDVEIIYI